MILKKIDKFLASVLSLLICTLQFSKSFVSGMKPVELYNIPENELEKVEYRFSIDNPKNKRLTDGAPIRYNELIEVKDGKETYHIRLLAFNAPCLLAGNSGKEFKHMPGIVTAHNMDRMIYNGMNIIHALANMTVDSYLTAKDFKYLAKKDSEEALKIASESFGKIVNADEYKPIVNAVQDFVSQYDLSMTVDEAKAVIVACMIESKDAKTGSNVAKLLYWGSLGLSFFAGALGTVFPPAWAIIIPSLGLNIAASVKMDSSDKLVKSVIESMKVVNYADMFAQFKNLLLNRGEYVGKNNICVMAFDDMTDLESKKTWRFVNTRADALSKYKNKGAFCDFIRVRGSDDLAPCIKDYRNESGQNIFLFYIDVFHRMNISESVEDFNSVQRVLKGKTSQQK